MGRSAGLVWLIWILVETVRLGIGGIVWSTFTEMTPAPEESGGLANAIVGSLYMVGATNSASATPERRAQSTAAGMAHAASFGGNLHAVPFSALWTP